MKIFLKPLLIIILLVSCDSNFDFEDRITYTTDSIFIRSYDTLNIIDTIYSQTIDTVFKMQIDTIYIEKTDTIYIDKIRTDTIYVENTIYKTDTIQIETIITEVHPVIVKFLYHNDTQQILTADTIYLDGSEVVTWDVTQYDACIDIVKFELK